MTIDFDISCYDTFQLDLPCDTDFVAQFASGMSESQNDDLACEPAKGS